MKYEEMKYNTVIKRKRINWNLLHLNLNFYIHTVLYLTLPIGKSHRNDPIAI